MPRGGCSSASWQGFRDPATARRHQAQPRTGRVLSARRQSWRVLAGRKSGPGTGGGGKQEDGGGGTDLLGWLSGTFKSNKANEKFSSEASMAAAGLSPVLSEEERQRQRYPWWWVLPLQPYAVRKTIREELLPGRMWSFEQPHGAINIVVNIRMTVIRLEGGGLWVHAPIAPTEECVALVRELVASHGPVQHIVHPTYAVEHKVFVGRFSQAFPKAQVWVVPGQWSYPLPLPMSWLGVFPQRVHVLGKEAAPWEREIEFRTLTLPLKGVGPFVEAAFFHAASRTLLVTDLLVAPSPEPPPVCVADPTPLLLTEREDAGAELSADTGNVQRGWMKTVLLALYLRPDAVQVDSDGGFAWDSRWEAAFRAVSGRVLVPPILRRLVLSRYPQQVLSWAEDVTRWPFTHVVAAHFSARVAVDPPAVRRAFAFLDTGLDDDGEDQSSLLNDVNKFLVEYGLAEDVVAGK
eukprot:jgi/Tetstr1/454725/TSEL_041611.t1